MWKIVHYRKDGAYVVGIGTYPSHACLFFVRARELDDPTGLLEGGGKEMRFIRPRGPADAERAAVKRTVRKAFELGAARPKDEGHRGASGRTRSAEVPVKEGDRWH